MFSSDLNVLVVFALTASGVGLFQCSITAAEKRICPRLNIITPTLSLLTGISGHNICIESEEMFCLVEIKYVEDFL